VFLRRPRGTSCEKKWPSEEKSGRRKFRLCEVKKKREDNRKVQDTACEDGNLLIRWLAKQGEGQSCPIADTFRGPVHKHGVLGRTNQTGLQKKKMTEKPHYQKKRGPEKVREKLGGARKKQTERAPTVTQRKGSFFNVAQKRRSMGR